MSASDRFGFHDWKHLRVRVVVSLVRIVGLEADAKRSHRRTFVRVLVDVDQLLVAQDFERLVGGRGEVGADDEMGLRQRPHGEMGALLGDRQVADRHALAVVPDLEDVQVAVLVVVGGKVARRLQVDDCSNARPANPGITESV